MTLGRHSLTKLFALFAALAAFVATLGVVAYVDGDQTFDGDSQTSGALARNADERIQQLKAGLQEKPRDPQLLTALGNSYLQKVRETADSSHYRAADAAFTQALAVKPNDAGALAGMGSLELARHHFQRGLGYGQSARAQSPGVARVYGVIVDAQVELGRYGDAARSLQRMVDLKPNLSSYARVSYLRELHGDFGGALQAMRLAVSAGGEAPENLAYVQTLLGNLQFQLGNIDRAKRAYRTALSRYDGYSPAIAGLAKAKAASGDLSGAVADFRVAATRVGSPEHLLLLGEAELAAGQRAAARRHFADARGQEQIAASNGESTATELAISEADHGSPQRAVKLGRQAWRVAPSVRAANALGWSLTRAGRPQEGLIWMRRALELGSKDALFLYHAGISARDAGKRGEARNYLTRSLARNPDFSPLHAPRAKRALNSLSAS